MRPEYCPPKSPLYNGYDLADRNAPTPPESTSCRHVPLSSRQQRLGQNGYVSKLTHNTRLCCMSCLFLKDSHNKISTQIKCTINSQATVTVCTSDVLSCIQSTAHENYALLLPWSSLFTAWAGRVKDKEPSLLPGATPELPRNPCSLPAGCPRLLVLHVQLTMEPSGTQEDSVHVMLGLVGGSAHYSNQSVHYSNQSVHYSNQSVHYSNQSRIVVYQTQSISSHRTMSTHSGHSLSLKTDSTTHTLFCGYVSNNSPTVTGPNTFCTFPGTITAL